MKQILDYEIVDHGLEYDDVWQGCSNFSHPKFSDSATGIGCHASEAFEDACESLAQQGYDVEPLFLKEGKNLSCEHIDRVRDEPALFYYLSIRVKGND